jgi:hypothetical protein
MRWLFVADLVNPVNQKTKKIPHFSTVKGVINSHKKIFLFQRVFFSVCP